MKKVVISIMAITMLSIGTGTVFAGDADKGAKLFKKKCKACHLTTDKKKVGPGLKGVYGRKGVYIEKLDDESLHKWLKDPKKVNKKAKMMNLKLKDDQIDDLIEYLKTL